MITLGLLILLWQGAATARSAAAIGFAFGAGLFGAGASWVFIALHTFGGMPWPVAAIGTAGFCAFLALYPAAVGWLAARWTAQGSGPRALAAAGAWTVAEWARSIVFTGFPWLSLGYASLPGGPPTPLAGYAPLGGVFLVSLVTALAAAAAALAIDALGVAARARAAALVGAAVVIVAGGAALSRIEWTSAAGAPVAISLVQGNVTQDLKFDPDFRARTFDLYTDLVAGTRGRLVVLPESAFPVFADEVPDAVLLRIIGTVVPRDGDAHHRHVHVGTAAGAGDGPRYYNSVVTVGTAPPQLYRKRHLVPFGETIPLEPVVGWFIRRVLAIPLASQARGDPDPPPLRLAGEQRRGQHLLRGRVRRRHKAAGAGGDAARQRDQRRVVRPLARRRAAQPDRRDARDGDRSPAAARDQHRHHVGDRPRRTRDRAPALVHARDSRSRNRGAAGRDAVRPMGRRSRRRDRIGALHRSARVAPSRRKAGRLTPPRFVRRGDAGKLRVCRASPPRRTMPTFQQVILNLQDYWDRQGCALLQPYDMEVGAGTSHTATFLRALGPEPWRAAYVQPSRRPKDGRYGENPNRMQHYYQYQVVLKPSPADILELYLGSLEALGFDLRKNDVRFVEDDWENPTLGAWGLGWEVWLNGMEVTQFTYFQQVGGLDCNPITGEITYGLERLAMYLQGKENVFDLVWTERKERGETRQLTYRDVYHQNEVEQSTYNFEQSNAPKLFELFAFFESEAKRLLEAKLPLPGYEMILKAAHTFNLLDARGAISVTERAAYIGRIRTLSRLVAQAYVDSREALGFPMLPDELRVRAA